MQKNFIQHIENLVQDLKEIFPFSKEPVITQQATNVFKVTHTDSPTDTVTMQINTNVLTFQLFMQFRMATIPYTLTNYQYLDTPDNFKQLFIQKIDADLRAKYGVSYEDLISRFYLKPSID